MGRLSSTTTYDLGTIEGLGRLAQKSGFGNEAEEILDTKPKLSFLQRLSKGLGAFNPAEAILTGTEKGVGRGVFQYGKGILTGIGSAIAGTDYDPKRRNFSDVAEELGVDNKIAKFGIGFLGDVLLDPTTYFGGAIAKGLGFVVKGAGRTALTGIGRVAPEVKTGLELVGTGLKDALGRAFKYGYKASKGATDDVLTFLSKEQKAKLGLASSNLNRLGTGVLTKSQQEELALKMIAGKRAEFAAREAGDAINANASDFIDDIQIDDYLPETAQNAYKKFTRIFKAWKDAPEDFAQLQKTTAGKELQKSIYDTAKEMDIYENDVFEMFKDKLKSQNIDLPVSTGIGETKYTPELLAQSGQIGKEAALTGTSPEVAKIIEAQIARSKKFAKIADIENPYESYYPFLKKDKLTKFLNETKGIKVGSEGYRKQFKNLMTNDNLEKDIVKAFFTREAQIVTDRQTRDFLSGFVKKYGKPLEEFKDSDEALKAGYQLIKEKGMFGKPLGYVSKYDGALIKDSISPEFQTINMLAKATGFDAITSLFKRAVTGLFLPFHIRNFVSGQIQNFEALGVKALDPRNIANGQKIAWHMATGKKVAPELEGILKPFVDRFSGDTFYNADFLQAVENGGTLKQAQGIFSKGAVKETAKTLGLGQEAIPFKAGRAIGQFIEHQQKATAYVTALAQGKTTQEALKLAEVAGFDYRALTRFESQIMRRIIPFYSFTRKNIGLQLKTLGENPQRINQVLSFFENLGEPISADEKKSLPEYLAESIGIKISDTPEGLKQYISNFGTPIEAFGQLFGKNPILRAISQSNPILKVPVEIGIGKDSFRQRDLQEVYDAREYKLAPQVIKDLLQLKEVKKDVLKKTPSGKLVKIGDRIAYVADPVRLLIARSLFTSRGVSYLDQVFGGDLKGLTKVLKTTTGLKPQQVDIEQQKGIKESKKKRELEDLLTRYGVAKQFTRTYIPKK